MVRKVLFKLYNATASFINPQRDTKQLLAEVGQSKARLEALKQELIESEMWRAELTFTMDSLTNAMGALTWRKDADNRYILASPLHCENFFGISGTAECLEFIKGKNDDELIDVIYRQRNIVNTFGKMCMTSDNYTAEKGMICHFLEAGVVAGDQVLLYVVKIPQFNSEGVYVGTVGIAWDFTKYSEDMIQLLNRWIYSKKAEKLFKENDVYAYALKPGVQKCDIFAHVCPNPMRDENGVIKCDDVDCVNCGLKALPEFKEDNHEEN